MQVIISDGGRAAAGFKGETGDCVTRAIAIATNTPYQQVYDELHERLRLDIKSLIRGKTSPRDGVARHVYQPYLATLGWVWTPTMHVGQGCTVHLRESELPTGRLIVAVSRHLCAVVDGVIYDTFDPSREGTRCVYGYYHQEEQR